MRRKIGATRLLLGMLSTIAMIPARGAQTLTYGVDAGLGETDNVTLVSTNKVSQTIAVADADFNYKQQSRRLDVIAKGYFSYFDYLQSAFSSQLVGRFDGAAHWALIPQRLTWVLQDNFGQAALDPYTPVTPGNLENINYVSTGPDLALRLGGTGFLNISARAARAQYGVSPFTSNRLQGSLGLGRELSAQSSVSLNADTEKVLFENTVVNTDFESTNAYLRYQLQGARTGVSLDLGATRVTRGAEAITGSLVKIALTRQISSASALTLSAGRQLTDASSSFSSLQSGAIGVVGTASATQTSASYTQSYATAGWQYTRNRTAVGISARWEKDIFNGAPQFDVTRRGGEFRVERKLTHAFSAALYGQIYKTDYLNARAAFTLLNGSTNFDDASLFGALIWRYGRGLEVRLRGEHGIRSTPGIIGGGYSQNRIFFTVGYRPNSFLPGSPGYLQNSNPGT